MSEKKEKRQLINWLGLLGLAGLVFYTAAVIFSPRAYPGYDWMAQAVSDLGADDAPSRALWNGLSCPYGFCSIVSVMMVCVYIRGKMNTACRAGIYLFAAMNWVSAIGYAVFPLSTGGYAGAFQDIMHVYAVTAPVVVLSVASLAAIIAGGIKDKSCRALMVWAAAALAFMLLGAVGVNAVPPQYFGIPERFSVFAAAGFNAVLGIYLFNGFPQKQPTDKAKII